MGNTCSCESSEGDANFEALLATRDRESQTVWAQAAARGACGLRDSHSEYAFVWRAGSAERPSPPAFGPAQLRDQNEQLHARLEACMGGELSAFLPPRSALHFWRRALWMAQDGII